jgi:hypothetical protein
MYALVISRRVSHVFINEIHFNHVVIFDKWVDANSLQTMTPATNPQQLIVVHCI